MALVGAGRMGGGMARRVAGAKIDLVLFNRTRATAEALGRELGARVAGTAREAASAADVVVSSLADDTAVKASYEGPDGLAAGLRTGTVVLESSTIDPATVAEMAALVEERGASLLDTPVSGSVPLLERGELMVMAGGDPEVLERARPVLETWASRIIHVGKTGAGATMKLAVNAVVHGLNQALAEGLVLAERAGVERTTAYEVFASSAAAAPFVLYKRPAYERPDEAPVAFSLDLSAKDFDLILALAERVGVPMDQAAVNREVARGAIAAGMGQRDLSAIAEFLRGREP
ncbi:MAG: NAD(P)-dependent oxidoreductase [Actinomycetota bacterium]